MPSDGDVYNVRTGAYVGRSNIEQTFMDAVLRVRDQCNGHVYVVVGNPTCEYAEKTATLEKFCEEHGIPTVRDNAIGDRALIFEGETSDWEEAFRDEPDDAGR